MKKFLFLLLAFLAFSNTKAQIIDPVKWTSRTEKVSDSEFILVFEAKIDDDWHVYSQFTPEDGPLPIVFDFEKQEGNYQLVGKASESATKRRYSEVFGVDEVYFSKSAVLKQKVKILNPSVSKIEVQMDYQVCKESCINQQQRFSFAIPRIPVPKTAGTMAPVLSDTLATAAAADTAAMQQPEIAADNSAKPGQPKGEGSGIWKIFLGTLLAGFVSTFTPCVFPMIPMTVSFFLKQTANKAKGRFNAFFYGFCIVAICVLITLPFHLIEGMNPDIFLEISTNVYLNIFFFIVFVVFAISFFGAFEITLPSSFANKVDAASNRGGMLGIFFMALTLIIVSFSCIGPALGFVFGTALSSDGGATVLTLAMLGFGLGLSLPFMFFALAPNLLGNLPRSGGWLNTVKVVFGFIELALAFKFLSNADLVLQTHLLEREVFLALWIAIFGALALYLFGKIRMPHDSDLPFLSVGRMLFGVLTLAFTVYLVPGLWGSPLKLISAFPPPQTYSESPLGFGGSASTPRVEQELAEGAAPGPHGIITFEDYAHGLAYAKKTGKPVLVDFTGRACQNCRLMENNVWSDPRVLEILKNDVVLVSLFGDERTKLPEAEHYVSGATGNKISTVGQKWSEFQRARYGTNARPFYVMLDANEKQLSEPVGYTPDTEEFLAWLKVGKEKVGK